MGFIYKITNQINGKIYIGQTVQSIATRWKQHINDAYAQQKCLHLCAAIVKYGEANFTVEEIEKCPLDELDQREIYWIKKYDSQNCGYNITAGGKGTNKEISQELLEELWDKGLTTEEIAQETNCTRQWVRKRLKSYENYNADEGRKRGAKHGGKAKNHCVQQYDINGNLIQEFISIKQATESTGINNISRSCIKGTRAGGYYWKYKDN